MRVMTVEEYIKLPTFVRKVNKFQNLCLIHFAFIR